MLKTWLRETSAREGWLAAAGQMLAILWEFLRDSTPDRRRARFGDADYDWDHWVDTTSGTVSWRNRLEGLLHSPYQPTEPVVFHEMLAALPIDYHRFTFIDLGSGKGRALLMASDFPFRRIVGVELLPELDHIAQRNIRAYHSPAQQCPDIASMAGDARQFEFPPDPSVVYLFNPFPEPILRAVCANLHRSLIERPRELYVLYHNLAFEGILLGSLRVAKVRVRPSIQCSPTSRSLSPGSFRSAPA
jgi:hypothetical protein